MLEKLRRPLVADALIVGGYLFASFAIFARLWKDFDGRLLAFTHADEQGFEWIILAASKLIASGHNPLFTDWQNAPDGINVMAQTSVLGLSVPLIPLTLTLGPAFTFALLLSLAPALTAAAWYWLFSRHLVSSRLAAAIAGGLCGFCPPLISHANGAHLNYIALFVLPFILWWTIRLREPGRWLRNGAILGLLVTYQLFVGEEPLLVAALAIAVFLVAWAVMRPGEARTAAKPFFLGLGVAAAVTIVLSGYPLWFQFFGPQSYGAIPHASRAGNDVFALTSFASQSLGGGHPVTGGLAMNPSEENGFLGWPLLVLALVVAVWMWRASVVARAATVTGVFLLWASLGVEVVLDGRHTGIAGLWKLLANLPLVGSILPGRLVLAAVPAIAAVLALATDRLLEVAPQVKLVWFGALAAVLLPIVPTLVETQQRPPVPVFFTSGDWKHYVTPGQTVLTIPPPNGSYAAPLRWQIVTDMEFSNVDGYFIGPHGEDRHGWYGAPVRPTTELLYKAWQKGEVPAVTDADRQRARDDLAFWKAGTIVLGPGHTHQAELLKTAEALFGPGRQVDDVWVWDLRNRS